MYLHISRNYTKPCRGGGLIKKCWKDVFSLGARQPTFSDKVLFPLSSGKVIFSGENKFTRKRKTKNIYRYMYIYLLNNFSQLSAVLFELPL
jgi:hypothetical protein